MKALEKILENNNVKPTAMRLLVLQFLLDKKVAVSLTNLEDGFDRCDRTTLYRTLKTFVTSELVHKIDDGTGITKYAMCEEGCHCAVEKDLHVHFHCNVCDETICLPNEKIPHINLPEDYTAEGASLVVIGVCEKCKNC